MNRALACALAVGLLFATAAPALAREAKGKVKSWEESTRVITLEDGSQYVVTDKVKTIEKIKTGKLVKMQYEEQNGRNMVSELDEVESP